MTVSSARAVRVVAAHDLLDLRRQRGVWVGLLVIPFVTISFLLLLPGVLAEREQQHQATAVYRVVVQPAPEAAAVRAALPSSRFRVTGSADARRDVTSSRADAGVRLTTVDVAGTLASDQGQVAGEILVLAGRGRSRGAVGALVPALERFGLSLTDRRLAAHGLPPATVRPFTVTSADLSQTPRGRRLNLATLLPLLVLLPLAGTVGVAAQRISGSKDQRVFEPLLVLPFTRRQLLLGKALSSVTIGSVTLLAVGAPLVVGRFVPIGSRGQLVSLPVSELAAVVGIGGMLLVLLVLLGSAVGAAARTSAELSSVLQLVTLPIFLLGSFLQFRSGIQTTTALLVVPFLGALLCVRDVAIGSLTVVHLATAAAATVAWGTACVFTGVRLLESERSVLRSTA
ncbi:MAG TPA: ABC transporter permease subunit [Acidimicrobiales bacterium]|nr:ABC transporter permease subunit [Acidimicrobiales bacterium]